MTEICTADSRVQSCAAILLAAGAGRRFGTNKLLNASLNDKPLGLVAAETYKRVLPVYVVVRVNDEGLKALYENAGYAVIVAEHAERGMGNSLHAGLQRIASTNHSACLVGLADMPLVEEDTLRLLCARIEAGAEIVRPLYRGRSGQPVGFTRRHFENLIRLKQEHGKDQEDDKGARDYLVKHENLIDYVQVDDAGTITDVDTPEDLANLSASV